MAALQPQFICLAKLFDGVWLFNNAAIMGKHNVMFFFLHVIQDHHDAKLKING